MPSSALSWASASNQFCVSWPGLHPLACQMALALAAICSCVRTGVGGDLGVPPVAGFVVLAKAGAGGINMVCWGAVVIGLPVARLSDFEGTGALGVADRLGVG